MKSVLLSIKPEWCELIASGKKTLEVRKTKPKLNTPFKCYIYCTKGKSDNQSSGKVIGEFTCDDMTSFGFTPYYRNGSHGYYMASFDKISPEELFPITARTGMLRTRYRGVSSA